MKTKALTAVLIFLAATTTLVRAETLNFALSALATGFEAATEDTTPSAFSFTAKSNVDPNTVIQADEIVTVSGLGDGVNAEISIAGTGVPKFRIDTGTGFGGLETSGTVKNGDKVQVSLETAVDAWESAYAATLTIGTESSDFFVTTRAADSSPDSFSIAAAPDIFPAAIATSDAITLNGFEVDVPVSLSGTVGSEYSMDNGLTWVPLGTPGTVSPGDAVLVRVQTSNALNTPSVATLTVGDKSASFTATTASSYSCGSDGLSALALGQKTCSDPVYYVGNQSGTRLYAKTISGTYAYRTGLTSSGGSSTSDGQGNTDSLISSSVWEHEAA